MAASVRADTGANMRLSSSLPDLSGAYSYFISLKVLSDASATHNLAQIQMDASTDHWQLGTYGNPGDIEFFPSGSGTLSHAAFGAGWLHFCFTRTAGGVEHAYLIAEGFDPDAPSWIWDDVVTVNQNGTFGITHWAYTLSGSSTDTSNAKYAVARVLVFGRAFSEAEVLQQFGQRGPIEGSDLYYPCDDAGTVEQDQSGNNRDSTLIDSTTFTTIADEPSDWQAPAYTLAGKGQQRRRPVEPTEEFTPGEWFGPTQQATQWFDEEFVAAGGAAPIEPDPLVGTANPTPVAGAVPAALVGAANPTQRLSIVGAPLLGTANPTQRASAVPAALLGTANPAQRLGIVPSALVGVTIGGPALAIVSPALVGSANPEPSLPLNPIIPAAFTGTANPTPAIGLVPAAFVGAGNPGPAVAIAPTLLVGTASPKPALAVVAASLTGSANPTARAAVVPTPLVGTANPAARAVLSPVPLVGTASPTQRAAAVPAAFTGSASPTQRAAIVTTGLVGSANPQPIMSGGAILPATLVAIANPKPVLGVAPAALTGSTSAGPSAVLSPVPLAATTNPTPRAALVPTALTPSENPRLAVAIRPVPFVPSSSGRPTLSIAASALVPLAMAAGAALAIVQPPFTGVSNPQPALFPSVAEPAPHGNRGALLARHRRGALLEARDRRGVLRPKR